MHCLITGITGPLGRSLLQSSAGGPHLLSGLSRHPPPASDLAERAWRGADLATGAGLWTALNEIDVVIHAASDPRRPAIVDVGGTERLMSAARAAGVQHVIYVSIVGVDRIPYAYYRAKHAAERLVAASGVPFTIVRAAQFHSFVDALLRRAARYPLVLPLPRGFTVQSVDIGEVAARLLRAVTDGPTGRVIDFAGPEVLRVTDAAHAWLAHTGRRKIVLPLPLPGAVGAAFRAGYNTAPDGERGRIRWIDWLQRLPSRA